MNFRRVVRLGAFAVLAAYSRGETDTPDWLAKLHLAAHGSVARVDNLSRTSSEKTRQDGTTYEFSLNSSLPRQLTRQLLLVAGAEVSSLSVPDYDLANKASFAGRLALQTKFGLGPQATVLKFSAGAAYKSARLDADCGWTTEAGIELAKRILPNLRLAARGSVLEHGARSATFDLNQHSLSLDAQWDIDDRWTLSGSAGRLSGNIVANASASVWVQALSGALGQSVSDSYNARPWSVTNLYGANWISYNVDADVDLWSVTLGYALTDHTSVELSKAAAYVVNQIGVSYPTDSWGLSLNHRF